MRISINYHNLKKFFPDCNRVKRIEKKSSSRFLYKGSVYRK